MNVSFRKSKPKRYCSLPSRYGRAVSVCGGPGGRCVRPSGTSRTRTPVVMCPPRASCPPSGLLRSFSRSDSQQCSGVLLSDEKGAMQDLNDRLAGYLGKVRYLEGANRELECKIKDGIESLMYQIEEASVENSQLVLAIDNARLTAEDFRKKWEIEVSLREELETDIQDLRNLANEYCECHNTVACEVNVIQDEIYYLKQSHREIEGLRCEYANSTLNVDIDHSPNVDLSSIINDIRTQYETMIGNTHYEVECLMNNKATKNEANNMRYEFQSLEVEAESLHTNCTLEENLRETEERLNLELSNLAEIISSLEAEYTDVRANIERQIREYESLLNVKMQLEMEIGTYQKLIEGEDCRTISNIEKANTQVPSVDCDIIPNEEEDEL
uniref:Kertain 95 n=1 Tax=Eptatretus burgeri TaxID=7764 RepID=A0A8C4Q6F0_EPTBU